MDLENTNFYTIHLGCIKTSLNETSSTNKKKTHYFVIGHKVQMIFISRITLTSIILKQIFFL